MEQLTPREIVAELDRYIVGQDDAKKAVAIALRNRFRRRQLEPAMQQDVLPKNILMIGPTGVGKTEIARRLARLVKAPFTKIEVTKFTEVGYVGRDVESMVRDLVETAIRMVENERMEEVQERARKLAGDRILDHLAPLPQRKTSDARNPLQALWGKQQELSRRDTDEEEREHAERLAARRQERRRLEDRLAAGELDEREIEIEVEDRSPNMLEIFGGQGIEEMGINFQDMLGNMLPRRRKKRRVTVAEAREILTQEEARKLIDEDAVVRDAVDRVEQGGIVFLDELDKIAAAAERRGADVSREGVQRDILPIVEGSTVMTKHGPVKTDHILFIAAGAFHMSKPSDLIPELQGRFPIRVELNALTESDFRRILTEPRNSLVRQYTELLATEGVALIFTDDAIGTIAEMAFRINEQTENIGARRLHTVMEKVLEEVSFHAPDVGQGEVEINETYVKDRLHDIIEDTDLSRYIL